MICLCACVKVGTGCGLQAEASPLPRLQALTTDMPLKPLLKYAVFVFYIYVCMGLCALAQQWLTLKVEAQITVSPIY